MKDDLGDRIKRDYEDRTRFLLPRRTYTLLRIDGKAFHRYTRDCARPYDTDLMADRDAAALAVCERIDGARLAFVQSDEISVLLTDFGSVHAAAWFDGNLQKIASLSASLATAYFNRARALRGTADAEPACFDSRVWTMPPRGEVFNCFVWRQQDATRNSLTMTARAHFSHEEVVNKTGAQLQERLWQEKGINWNDLPVGFKCGRVIERVAETADKPYIDKRTGEETIAPNVTRYAGRVVEPPIFTQDRAWLLSRIPAIASTE